MTTRPPLLAENRAPVSWIDQQMIQTSWLMLIALTALFFGLVWIFSGVALFATRHPVARRKARILFGICTVYALFVGVLVYTVIQSEV